MDQVIQKQSILTLKKTAFRTKIRRQWLDQYFNQKRKQLLQITKQNTQQKQITNNRLLSVLSCLPSQQTFQQLIIQQQSNPKQLLQFFTKHLSEFSETISQLSIKMYNFYVHILMKILISKSEQVMHLTMRKIIHQAKRIMKEHKLLATSLFLDLIQFVMLLTPHFNNMDQLQLIDLVSVFTQALQYAEMNASVKEIQNILMYTLTAINQCLTSTFKTSNLEQNKQNISNWQKQNFQLLKSKFISKLFTVSSLNLKKIIHCLFVNIEKKSMIKMGLKCLINLTYYTTSLSIFNKLFDVGVEHLIFICLNSYKNQNQIFALLCRLVNNLMVTSHEMCELRINSMQIKRFVTNFNKFHKENIDLTQEICQFFSTVITFMDYSRQVISYLEKENIFQLIMDGLKLIKSSETLTFVLSVFQVLAKYQHDTFTQLIVRNQIMLKNLQLEHNDITIDAIIDYIIELSRIQQDKCQNYQLQI